LSFNDGLGVGDEVFENMGGMNQGLFSAFNNRWAEGGCLLFCFRSPENEFNGFYWAHCQNVGIEEEEKIVANCLTIKGISVLAKCSFDNSVLKVYNTLGQSVYQTPVKQDRLIDCSFLPNGVYTAVIESEKERSVLKFAVTR